MNYLSYNDLLICCDSERCVIFYFVPVSTADRLQSIKKKHSPTRKQSRDLSLNKSRIHIYTGTVSKRLRSCITLLFLSPLNVEFELLLTIFFLNFQFYFHSYFSLFHGFNVPIVGKMHVDFVSNHMANICRKNLKLILGF